MPHAMEHCHRPWWKRPPFWFVGIAAVLLFAALLIEQADKPVLTPYSVLLDQIEAGNIASVTIQGTEIDGRYKQPLDRVLPSGAKGRQDSFRSRVPDFGDPALISELRKQHVVIVVGSPSQWTSLLAHLPWPMLIILGVAILAGVARVIRGGRMHSDSVASMLPAHGMMGLLSRLFVKRGQTTSPPTNDGDKPNTR